MFRILNVLYLIFFTLKCCFVFLSYLIISCHNDVFLIIFIINTFILLFIVLFYLCGYFFIFTGPSPRMYPNQGPNKLPSPAAARLSIAAQQRQCPSTPGLSLRARYPTHAPATCNRPSRSHQPSRWATPSRHASASPTLAHAHAQPLSHATRPLQATNNFFLSPCTATLWAMRGQATNNFFFPYDLQQTSPSTDGSSPTPATPLVVSFHASVHHTSCLCHRHCCTNSTCTR